MNCNIDTNCNTLSLLLLCDVVRGIRTLEPFTVRTLSGRHPRPPDPRHNSVLRECLFPAECVTGIEPAPSVWKTDVLPLTPYTHIREPFVRLPNDKEVPVFIAAMDRHGVGPCSSALRADAFTGLAFDPKKITVCILPADGLAVIITLFIPEYLPKISVCKDPVCCMLLLLSAPYIPCESGALQSFCAMSNQAAF